MRIIVCHLYLDIAPVAAELLCSLVDHFVSRTCSTDLYNSICTDWCMTLLVGTALFPFSIYTADAFGAIVGLTVSSRLVEVQMCVVCAMQALFAIQIVTHSATEESVATCRKD